MAKSSPSAPAQPDDLITDESQITPTWLTRRLRNNGHLPTGEVQTIEPGKRFQNRAGFFAAFKASYSVEPPPSLHEHLILRLCHKDRVEDALADLDFFAKFTEGIDDPPVPRHYDHLVAPDKTAAHFLMEDLNTTHKPQSGRSLEEYALLIEGLLKFHIRWWEDDRLAEPDMQRRAYGPIDAAQATDPATTRKITTALNRDFAKYRIKYKGAVIEEYYDLTQRIIDVWPDLFIPRSKTGKALTLLHGDYHFGNVFLPNPPLSENVAILDWECAMKGIGVSDLALLFVQSHHTHKRRDFEMPFLKLYHNNLRYYGIEDYSWDECLYDYRLSLLAQVFVPLRWNSPRDLKRPVNAIRDWDCEELL